MIQACVITLSDKGARGEREDRSGPAAEEMLKSIGAEVVYRDMLPDEKGLIAETLIKRSEEVDLIITTGGTGLSPRDVTPEATLEVIDREVPGVAEAIRAAGMARTPRAMLSRGVAGMRGKALIVNLPGSERAVREGLAAVLEVLPHAVAKIKGCTEDCAR